MRRTTILLALALGMALALPACEDEFVDPPIQPPLIVSAPNVFPGEEAQLPAGDIVNVSVTFNRALTSPDEAILRIFPPPASTGELTLTGSGRNLTWFQVEPAVGSRVQRLFIDGPTMPDPFLRTWFTGSPIPQALFSGSVIASDTWPVDPAQAVIFALDPFSDFNPLDPGTLTGVQPLSIALAVPDPNKADVEAPYVMGRLFDRTQYVVVAVVDSNDDAIYDPNDDWWGFFGDRLSNDPEVVTARAGFDSVATSVDIELRPPRGP